MGFKSLIAKQVQEAMKTLGTDPDGLAPKQTYISVGKGTYDPIGRTVVAAETLYTGVPMSLVRFSIDDMDEEVRPKTDRKALIASLDLPVAPEENDKVQLSNGDVYTVRRILKDPSEGLCILHIRKE